MWKTHRQRAARVRVDLWIDYCAFLSVACVPKMNKKYWRRSWPGKPIRSKHWANPLDYRTRRRFTNIIAVPQDDHRAGGRDLLDAKYPVSLFAKLLSGLHRSLRSLIVTML